MRTDNGEVIGVNIAIEDITRRKVADQQIRYLASLQEHMYDAVIGTDLDFRIQSWNKAAERLFGWQAGEVIGQPVIEILKTMIPGDADLAFSMKQLMSQGYWSGEAIQHHRDGTPVYVLGSIVLNRDENGQPIGVIAVNHNITARKEAEAALEQKHQEERTMQQYLRELHEISIDLGRTRTLDDFYRKAVEHGLRRLGFERMGLLLYDPDTGLVKGTYGTDSQGQLVDEHDIELYPHSLTGILQRTLERTERIAFDEEAELFTNLEPAGKGSNAAAALWNGELLGWLAIDNGVRHAPITRAQLDILALYALAAGSLLARKRAEFALRESEQRYRLLAENIQDVIIKLSPEGIHTFVTPSMYDLLGYHPEELLGKVGSELIHPEDLAQSERALTQTLKSGGNYFEITNRVRHKDGRYVWVTMSSTIVRDTATGEPVEIIGILHDATERINAENTLKQALEQEKFLGELKSRFVFMASHEFRTPLAAILATTETLTHYREKLDGSQIDARLNKIRQQVTHMKEIMDDVLELARMQAGRVEFRPVPGDLDALCQEIIEEFDSQTVYRGRLVYQCDHSPVLLTFDPRLMRQIISNLVHNALKYSASNRPVYLNMVNGDKEVTLSVQDEGIGIPEDEFKYLFEPFHRARNVGTISGTGLGLSIALQAAELHGGTILPTSEVNRGTTFTVPLPRLEASVPVPTPNTDHQD